MSSAHFALETEDVVYTLAMEPEDSAYDDGPFKLSARDIRWIRNQLAQGNEWAWCMVEVTAQCPVMSAVAGHDIEGRDGCGRCAYLSEADFCQDGGMYDEMKRIATDSLEEMLDRLYAEADAETQRAMDEAYIEMLARRGATPTWLRGRFDVVESDDNDQDDPFADTAQDS